MSFCVILLCVNVNIKTWSLNRLDDRTQSQVECSEANKEQLSNLIEKVGKVEERLER